MDINTKSINDELMNMVRDKLVGKISEDEFSFGEYLPHYANTKHPIPNRLAIITNVLCRDWKYLS